MSIDEGRKVQQIIVKPSDITERPDLLGTWCDTSMCHTIIESDTDVYLRETGLDGVTRDRVMLRFRKDYFQPEHVRSAYEGLREAAVPTQNRGLAAGTRTGKQGNRDWVTPAQIAALESILDIKPSVFGTDPVQDILDEYNANKGATNEDPRGIVWLSGSVKEAGFNFDSWMQTIPGQDQKELVEKVLWIKEKFISETTYANQVCSGIAGWFDRYPRIPFGRATAYTKNHPEQFAKAYPYLQALAQAFKELAPEQYEAQMAMVKRIDPRFYVPGTPFTTITVNCNFRTAAHFDGKNASVGFSNICSFSNNGCYRGCELVLPELGIAVNSRPGDLFLIDNQGVMHSNAPLELYEDEQGVMGERVSIVAYAREAMTYLGSWEYERAREDYVNTCKGVKSFNGVWPGMWESKGWREAGIAQVGEEEMRKWQPELFEEVAGLDAFF